MDLSGKAVIVTGSSSGIGEATARRFAALGAGIVVNSATSVEAGERATAGSPTSRRSPEPAAGQLAALRGLQGRSRPPHGDHGQARRGWVRVNAVAPGLVATPWTADWGPMHEAVAATAPLRRVANADDIAEACVSFAALTYATGQVLLVDGGLGLTI
jgi:NAD(P)-dependent dehydrogenase (short-subunit alcohol dehydrogenase family)